MKEYYSRRDLNLRNKYITIKDISQNFEEDERKIVH